MEVNNKRIAVLSGKGGTGKTLLSVNLASLLDRSIYIDCDVEEPNGHLFFKPENMTTRDITIKVPVIDEHSCSKCRKCVDFCKYNALAFIYKKVYVIEDICHSCGGCYLFCPNHAIIEKDKVIGEIKTGESKNVTVISGILNPGVESGVPIIKELLSLEPNDKLITFIDCPPGSSCTVMESIKDVDYCVLVAEPTIFGVHNLNMIYDLVKLNKKEFGVVLNKCIEGENPAETFCLKNDIKILGKIPFDNDLGTLNSNALISVRENKKYEELFSKILRNILKEVQHEKVVNP